MKTETKHTPGPYSISGIPGDNHIMARNGNERVTVAIVVGWPRIEQEEFDANKQLFATAPDLLTALDALLFQSEHNFGDCGIYDQARAAIAKAKGNQ